MPGSSGWDKLKVMGCSIRLQGGVRGMDAKRWAEPRPNTRELRPYMKLSAPEPPPTRACGCLDQETVIARFAWAERAA